MNKAKRQIKITQNTQGRYPNTIVDPFSNDSKEGVLVRIGIYPLIAEKQYDNKHELLIEVDGYENGVIITKDHLGFIEFI